VKSEDAIHDTRKTLFGNLFDKLFVGGIERSNSKK